MTERRRMERQDALGLTMDRPATLMVIGSSIGQPLRSTGIEWRGSSAIGCGRGTGCSAASPCATVTGGPGRSAAISPLSGNLPMSFTVCSYDGKDFGGIACDVGLVPDHEQIVEGFAGAFDRQAIAQR